MTTPIEKLAASKALEGWKAKKDAEAGGRRRGATGRKPKRGVRPPGWTFEEAAAIAGVPLALLEDWGTSLAHPHVAGEDDLRFGGADLFKIRLLAQLHEAGAPVLVLALVARDIDVFFDDVGLYDDGTAEESITNLAEADLQSFTAYPLTTALAERWVLHAEAKVGVYLRPPDALARILKRDPSSSLPAEDADARDALAAGEALAINDSAVAADVCRRIDKFWVANA